MAASGIRQRIAAGSGRWGRLAAGWLVLGIIGCTGDRGPAERLRDPAPGAAREGGGAAAAPERSAARDALAPQRERMVALIEGQLRLLVDEQGKKLGIGLGEHVEPVLEALRRVPRHEFVPAAFQRQAYLASSPLPIDENQTISAADVVGIMTAVLKLEGTERVLEIGTGSGYQAAVLGELVPEVYSMEIRPALAESARARLESLKERGILRHRKLEVITGDGYKGHPAKAPFDAIIVTAAPREVPVALINQLAVGGCMVIPVGDYFQELQLIERRPDGTLSTETILPVRFVPMVNEKEMGSER